MSERWVVGVWLGKRVSSDEHVVGLEDGSVCVSSAVRLLPDSESWDVEFVNKLRGTPWRPSGKEPEAREEGGGAIIPEGRPLDPGHPEQLRPARPAGVSRDLYIKREHLTKFGYTEGCAKCRSIQEGVDTTKGHSNACRERLVKAMREDGDTEELDKADERKVRFAERELEKTGKDSKRARRDDDNSLADISDLDKSSRRTLV